MFSVAFLIDALDGNNGIGQNCSDKEMRFHFLICLLNKVFSPFPKSTERSKVCASTILFVDVYYTCRRPFFEYEVEEHPKMQKMQRVVSSQMCHYSRKHFWKIVDWIGFFHTVNLVLP